MNRHGDKEIISDKHDILFFENQCKNVHDDAIITTVELIMLLWMYM